MYYKKTKFDGNVDGICPSCGKSWDGGSIFETLRVQKWTMAMTNDELLEKVHEMYSEPYRWSLLIGIEIPEKYDGISYWKCPFCDTTWDRWTGEEVDD